MNPTDFSKSTKGLWLQNGKIISTGAGIRRVYLFGAIGVPSVRRECPIGARGGEANLMGDRS
jgi:hypothetical protein